MHRRGKSEIDPDNPPILKDDIDTLVDSVGAVQLAIRALTEIRTRYTGDEGASGFLSRLDWAIESLELAFMAVFETYHEDEGEEQKE